MASFSQEEYFHKVDNMILISFQVLRKLFQKRWKKETGKDWENTVEQGKAFCENEGKHILKMTNDKFLKEKLLNGCLENWDMTTLSLVLRNFGDQTTYKVENDAVGELKDMRNQLSHPGSKKFSKAEYDEKVMKFKTYLRAIEVKDVEIDKIIEKAGNTSSSASLEATKKLYEQAEEYIKQENFVKALEYYNESTTMHSLLPEHQGLAYEKQAECHLKLAEQKKHTNNKDEADKFVAQALLNATTALELNDNSWNAHYIIAKCHRLQKSLNQAIQHFSKALAISPTQKHIKRDLDSCKALLGSYERKDNVDPRDMPMNLTERVAHLEAETGFKVTEQQFLYMGTHLSGRLLKGQDLVSKGHQHAMGWGVPQNDLKAFQYYEKAANAGNAEGIYNLGLCYAKPKGVSQDLSKAYDLYLRAANMPPDITSNIKMIGVSQAQHSLGLMYEEGIYVERDYSQAVEWYTKAIENGSGNAANNLAIMYDKGKGVPRNAKKAEMYWNQAVIFKDPNAASSLIVYYANQMEPEKARAMFRTEQQLRNNEFTEHQFNDWLRSTQSGRLDRTQYEDQVIAYEKEKNLDIKGMTFLERLQRYMFSSNPKIEKITNDMKEILSNEGSGGSMNRLGFDESCIHHLSMLAQQGSSTADGVLRAMFISSELGDLMTDNEVFDERNKNIILNLLYEFVTLNLSNGMGLFVHPEGKITLKRVIGQIFDSKCDGRQNEVDMKIRLCYVFLNKVFSLKCEDSYMEELLIQGIKMYPENIHYYDLLSNLYGNRGAWKTALEWTEKGLLIFPDHVELLYSKAVLLRKLSNEDEAGYNFLEAEEKLEKEGLGAIFADNDKVKKTSVEFKKSIAAYKVYLGKAPYDHRKLPEAYYGLANCYVSDVYSHLRSESSHLKDIKTWPSFKQLEHYYKMGQEAEGNMLPCYLPYSESDMKKFVKFIVNIPKLDADTSSSCSSQGSLNSSRMVRSSGSKPRLDFNRFSGATGTPQGVPNIDILEQKSYLTSPTRKELVLEHRKKFSLFKGNPYRFNSRRTQAPTLRQTAPTRMSLTKPITLKEMNPTSDHIYKDRILDLTIIEDPCFGFASVHLVAEDNNGDVTRLYIYNVEQNRETAKQLGHGATIAILNPYMRIGSQDITNGIRNDEPTCLIYLEGFEKICRFCGVDNAQHKCSKCKKASYCSRECQIHDFKIMKHNLICWE
ncbi:unnamed protein product [Orchesella dallaii]|uniref:MYND-type domain-containing protein n=1 Tax=Orchesella dallaii TaxID=48710 RepID=A0ABP1QM93_9HEXA